MKIAVIGSRTFNNLNTLNEVLNTFIDEVSLIISGGAKGADSLAELWANNNNIKTKIFLPEYNLYARGAPHIRNKLIIDNCDLVIAFWDKKSKGTKSALEYASKKNKQIKIYEFNK